MYNSWELRPTFSTRRHCHTSPTGPPITWKNHRPGLTYVQRLASAATNNLLVSGASGHGGNASPNHGCPGCKCPSPRCRTRAPCSTLGMNQTPYCLEIAPDDSKLTWNASQLKRKPNQAHRRDASIWLQFRSIHLLRQLYSLGSMILKHSQIWCVIFNEIQSADFLRFKLSTNIIED